MQHIKMMFNVVERNAKDDIVVTTTKRHVIVVFAVVIVVLVVVVFMDKVADVSVVLVQDVDLQLFT